jgi:serine/threonine protein kinase
VELHALGIIHRNLKPSKILFDPANKYACSRYNGAWDTT